MTVYSFVPCEFLGFVKRTNDHEVLRQRRLDWRAKGQTHAIPLILMILPRFVKSNPDLIARTEGQVNVTSPPPCGGWPRFVIYNHLIRSEAEREDRSERRRTKCTFNSSPSRSKNMARCGNPLTRNVSTLTPFPSVVMPFNVKLKSFFPSIAITSNGSRYQPIPLPLSQSCTCPDPPDIIPG